MIIELAKRRTSVQDSLAILIGPTGHCTIFKTYVQVGLQIQQKYIKTFIYLFFGVRVYFSSRRARA